MLKKFEKRIENFSLLKDEIKNAELASEILINAFKLGNKVLFCGNGGSASDSNHIACEFVSKFLKNRKALPAISLSSNNSIITAIGNDFSFEDIFERQIEALGNENDVLFCFSTSGKSKNILKAIKKAKEKGLKVIFLTGKNEVKNNNIDCIIQAPSDVTAEIQEMHTALYHIICEKVEEELF